MDIPPTSLKKREIWGTHHYLPLSETAVGKVCFHHLLPLSKTVVERVGGALGVPHISRFCEMWVGCLLSARLLGP